jgi:hypothetical protein
VRRIALVAAEWTLLATAVAAYAGRLLGRHRYVFVFRPMSFRVGLGLSVAGALALAGILWSGDRRAAAAGPDSRSGSNAGRGRVCPVLESDDENSSER